MRILRGLPHPLTPPGPGGALPSGNSGGVHRGPRAMLALLINEAKHRGLRSCVMTFEPHPRDFFARKAGAPDKAPTRIATLRDKFVELQRCGVDDVVILRFDEALASLPAEAFIEQMLVERLNA